MNEVPDVSEAPDNSVPKILVVDDDHEILKLIAMLLRRIGAEAWTFPDGQSALQRLDQTVPDLIILDLMLPDVDGLQILQQVRAQDQFRHVPVLILSAKADPDTIRKGLDLGADGYITKPYIANTLIDKVRLMLQSERYGRPQVQPPTD
jgi:two-component system alkaline phosphatase synthesis response regulator PhoP